MRRPALLGPAVNDIAAREQHNDDWPAIRRCRAHRECNQLAYRGMQPRYTTFERRQGIDRREVAAAVGGEPGVLERIDRHRLSGQQRHCARARRVRCKDREGDLVIGFHSRLQIFGCEQPSVPRVGDRDAATLVEQQRQGQRCGSADRMDHAYVGGRSLVGGVKARRTFHTIGLEDHRIAADIGLAGQHANVVHLPVSGYPGGVAIDDIQAGGERELTAVRGTGGHGHLAHASRACRRRVKRHGDLKAVVGLPCRLVHGAFHVRCFDQGAVNTGKTVGENLGSTVLIGKVGSCTHNLVAAQQPDLRARHRCAKRILNLDGDEELGNRWRRWPVAAGRGIDRTSVRAAAAAACAEQERCQGRDHAGPRLVASRRSAAWLQMPIFAAHCRLSRVAELSGHGLETAGQPGRNPWNGLKRSESF